MRAVAWLALALACGATAAAGKTLSIEGHEGTRAITAYAQVLEDAAGTLDFAAARAASAGWRTGPESALAFGFTRSVFWARWQIANTGGRAQDLVVDLGNPRQDHATWYLLRDNGERIETVHAGDRLRYSQRPLPARNIALPLPLAPGERVELIVRLASHDGLFEPMPVAIYDRAAFFAHAEAESQILTLYHGGLLALALYNLLLFATTRERAFGLYVGYISSLLVWTYTQRGYGFQFLWPEATAFNNNILTVGAAWAFGIFGLFTVEYLKLREHAPRWLVRLNQALAWTNIVVVALPAALDRYAFAAAFGQVTGVAMAVVSLSTGVWLLRRGQRQARFFVLAFAVLGVGATAFILQVAGLVPANAFTTWGVQVGSGFEALVLALGLADSLNMMKLRALNAERGAREAQQALTTRLEQQVQQRTQELEHVNRRLLALSVTDELTGAYNRRHFNAHCIDTLAANARADPLAFCMFDLDHFKAYNDRYGHQAGDAALQAVVAAVQQALKRSGDALFRLGGEEFGALFTAATPDHAAEFVERLREVVRNARIVHEGNPAGIMTASFGVAWWSAAAVPTLTPERVYAAADQALYCAKAAGRDRLELLAA